MYHLQSSYLACCLQRGQRGQWTTQLEELLDKLKKQQKKHDIAIKQRCIRELRITSIVHNNKCNSKKNK